MSGSLLAEDDPVCRTHQVPITAVETLTDLDFGVTTTADRLTARTARAGADGLHPPAGWRSTPPRPSPCEPARAAAAGGTTTLYATHDVAEAGAVADRVVVLAGGRPVADTTAAGMVRAAGLEPSGDQRSDLEDAFLALTHGARS